RYLVAVGDNPLDLHRWRQPVDWQVGRVDDADATQRREPQLSVWGPRNGRVVVDSPDMNPRPISGIEYRDVKTLRHVGVLVAVVYGPRPGVDRRARDAHQPARHAQPQRMRRVFDDPTDRVAGESIPAGQRGHAALLEPAEAAVGSHPQRSGRISIERADM